MAGDTLTTHLDAFRKAALSCSIPPAVELIGEKWAFLILRGAFNSLQHFEEFQAGLGIARNILSDRLTKLVGGGILERRADPDDILRLSRADTGGQRRSHQRSRYFLVGHGALPCVLSVWPCLHAPDTGVLCSVAHGVSGRGLVGDQVSACKERRYGF